MLKRIIPLLVTMFLVVIGLGAGLTSSATAADCVPTPDTTETIHHDAVTHVVHHDAVTHTVHHEAVPAGPDLWWNWSPNNTQEPQDYEPAFPVDARGTWQGPHENGGPDQDTYGTFNSSNENSGNSSWFHREHGTPAVDAYDEVVVDQEAYDELVVDEEAYDEIIFIDGSDCPPIIVNNPGPPNSPNGPNSPDSPHNSPPASVPTVIDAGL